MVEPNIQNNMSVLITGVGGFIGFHLAKRMLDDGYSVVAIDNLNDYYDKELKLDRLKKLGIEVSKPTLVKYKSNIYESFSYYYLDICDEKLESLFETHNIKSVIHLAGQAGVRYSLEKPEEYIKSNCVGFFNVINTAQKKGVKRFIYASSSSVYGNSNKEILDEDQPTDFPVSLYAATKKSNELIANYYNDMFKMTCIGLRFFTVYGPFGRPDMAYYKFLDKIINEELIEVYNNGELSRDFTFIDDVVEAVLRIHDSVLDVYSSVYNIGGGNPVSLLSFIKTLETYSGRKVRKKMLPMQPGDVYKTYANNFRFERDFGQMDFTPLDKGMRLFVDWYFNYHSTDE